MQHKSRIRLLGPKIALGASSVITIGAIIYSHYSQVRDKRVMKEGVERDKERIRYKRKMKQQQQIQSNTEKENKKGDNR